MADRLGALGRLVRLVRELLAERVAIEPSFRLGLNRSDQATDLLG